MVPGGVTYVTYLVVSRTNLPEFGPKEFKEFRIRRRFRDFVTLADRLADKYRGYFIPPRPDKNVIESQVMNGKEFIEGRRGALQKYLRRLAIHPVLRRTEELRLFLNTDGPLPLLPSTDIASRMLDGAAKLPRQLFGSESPSLSLPLPSEASQPARGGRDLLRMWKELRQSVSNDWGVGGGKPGLTEEEREFQERRERLTELEKRLGEASVKASQLVKAQENFATVFSDVGLALLSMGRFHLSLPDSSFSQKVHCTDCKFLGEAAIMVHRKWKECTGKTDVCLLAVEDQLASLSAVHVAFADRHQAFLTAQTLASDVQLKQEKAEKLALASSRVLGGDTTRTRRLTDLQEEIHTIEEAKQVADEELHKIRERNREELERFEVERKRDFFKMVEGFVRTQESLAGESALVWSKATENLEESKKSQFTRLQN